MRWAVVALLAAGCGCPAEELTCGSLLRLELTFAAWTAGEHVVTVRGEGLAFDCTVTVTADGTPPTNADISCGDLVERVQYLGDTGGTFVPNSLVLETPVVGTPEPVTVALTRAGQVLLEEVVDPVWRPVATQLGVCRDLCRVATLELAVDG